jgi:hypothetical protein
VASSPNLRRIGAAIASFDGDPSDAGEPPLEALPWLRFSAVPEPAELGPQQTAFSPLLVTVEQQVAGCDMADGFALWREVERTIFGAPGDAAGQAAARAAQLAAGISLVELVQPAGGIDPTAADAGTRQRSAATLRLHVYVPIPGF